METTITPDDLTEFRYALINIKNSVLNQFEHIAVFVGPTEENNDQPKLIEYGQSNKTTECLEDKFIVGYGNVIEELSAFCKEQGFSEKTDDTSEGFEIRVNPKFNPTLSNNDILWAVELVGFINNILIGE